ncbi:MAG: PAS domain-containing protein [Actinomycetota bacterium]|nr:PAS domain-containing protein [Actinomycetota bacterium]
MGGAILTVLYAFGPRFVHVGPVFNLIGATSIVAILVSLRMWKPVRRLPWMLMALGQAFFVTGDVITYNYERFFHSPLPFPSIGDISYLAVYPCLMAGILMLTAARNPRRDRASLIDSLIIATGVGAFSWIYLMSPQWHQPGSSLLVRLVSIAYPAMDLLLLAVIARMALAQGRRGPAFYLLLASGLCLLGTDTWYGFILNGAPIPGKILDIGWASFYVLWGMAALHPSMRSLEEAAVGPPASARSRWRLLLLAAASLVTPCVQLVQSLRGEPLRSPVAAAASIVVFGLVIFRLNALSVDVDEHRKTEDGLRKAQARYRAIVEHIPAIVYVEFMNDSRETRTTFVSPQMESILGYPPQRFVEDHEFWSRITHEEDRVALREDYDHPNHLGQAVRTEYRMLTRAGDVRWFRDESVLVEISPEGSTWQGVMLDVTEEELAQHHLRRAEERYRTLIEQIPAITYVDIWRGEIASYPTVYISPQVEEVLGVTPSEWIEDPDLWQNLLHPEDRQRMIGADLDTNRSGEPFSQEYRMLARDGRTVWIKDEAVMLEDPGTGDQYWHGVMQDITYQKAAESALRKALDREREASSRLHAVGEMKSAFMSAVSHELRTPLTVMIGTSDTLARHADALPPEDIKSFAVSLHAKSKQLEQLLSDLLDLEQLRQGKLAINPQPTDLDSLVQRVVLQSGVGAGHAVDVSVSCALVCVDSFKIERILLNLLTNASKYTPVGTQVWVRVSQHPDGVLILVEDAGPGVPDSLHESIFEPFKQGDGHRVSGTGIGLSIVAKFAELHGGKAWVGNRPGGGASFGVLVRPEPMDEKSLMGASPEETRAGR